MSDIEQLAREVARLQDQLEQAKGKLLAALGAGPTVTPPKAQPAPRATKSKLPVTQQLANALASAPGGLTRKQLQDQLGDTAALHSALKKFAEKGKITHSGVRGAPWKLAADKKKGPRP